MSDGELRSVQFRREREAAWRELEGLVIAVEKRGMRALDASDARRLAMLYRGTLSALSVARAISLDRNLVDWLESLCSRAYLCVYSSKRSASGALAAFFLRWFPHQMRRLRWHLLLAFVFLGAGMLAGFLLTLGDMELFYSFMPAGMTQGRNPAATTEFLRDGLYDVDHLNDSLAAFASFLFSHNARIGIMAFALGFVFGLPVFYLLFYNGLSLGAFAALYHSRGLSVDLWGWLLPHGVTELFAVVVCGAAGLVLAQALLFPDRHGRLDTLRVRGREAAGIALGAVVLFFIAALFEGFFRQLVTDVEVRYLTATTMAAFWLFYFLVLGRRGGGDVSLVDERAAIDSRRLNTPEGIELTVRLAPIGARAAAFVLDWLIIIAVTLLLAMLVVLAGGNGSFTAFFLFAHFLLRIFYFPFCELALQGSTPGKRSQKIRVIDSHGGPLSPRAIFARNLTREVEVFLPVVAVFSPESIWPGAGGLIGLFAALWCIALLLMPLFNRDRLRVGDLIAGTWVVTVPERPLLEDLSARVQQPRYHFTAEQLGHYGNYELHVLEDLLRNEGEVDRDTWDLVCTKIKQRIGWPKDAWEVEPLPFLQAFYAAQRARLERGLLFGVRHADKNEAREARQRSGGQSSRSL